MQKRKHRVTPEKIEEKIDTEVEKILSEEKSEDLDIKIREVARKKLEEKIESVVEEHIREKSEITPEVEGETKPETITPFIRSIKLFLADFHLCWRDSCRLISLIALFVYAAVITLLLLCHFQKFCITPNSLSSAFVFIVVMLIIGISLFLSLFSKYPKTGIIFWILLDIPLMVLLFLFTAKFIALIILGVIITLRLLQVIRGGY